ncbi:MAG: HD-GYP domain-containing protein [Gammaproteobacteria bacterium]|nr:HD-GYP domain-containing protein [Gammaproteobacteria bacterium]
MSAQQQQSDSERIDLAQVPANELRVGMYVAELDRPWLETPFLFQGFRIDSEADLAQVREHCAWALVPAHEAPGFAPLRDGASLSTPETQTPPDDPGSDLFSVRRSRSAPPQLPVEDELELAEPAHGRLRSVVHDIYESARAGRGLKIDHLEAAALPVVDSIGRNPDAMVWLSRLRSRDDYTSQHAVCCAIMAAGLGRHLGLARPALEALTMGMLVMDVGKTALPDTLLERNETFDETQRELFRTHVKKGLKLLDGGGQVGDQVRAIVAGHHERRDGSGYPLGLQGERISPFARIAGLVDAYDAMISDRSYRPRYAAHDALLELSRQRDRTFDAALVEQFIQSVGIYPTGSLVELSSGEVGIVIEQNRVRRLRPKIMLVLDADKKPLPRFTSVDLMVENDLHGEARLQISTPLKPGEYGIDPEEFYL